VHNGTIKKRIEDTLPTLKKPRRGTAVLIVHPPPPPPSEDQKQGQPSS